MKPAGLLALLLSLSATHASAQDSVKPPSGPLARSIAVEAARLAAVQSKTNADDVAWARVEKLDRGTEVAVLDREGNRVHGHFAEADDESLQLRDGALTNRISRADVLEIATVGPGKGSASAAVGFAVAGAVAAFFIDTRLAFSPCYGSCDSTVAMMVGLTAGLPVAGGFSGYYGFRKPAQRVVYSFQQASLPRLQALHGRLQVSPGQLQASLDQLQAVPGQLHASPRRLQASPE